MKWASAIGDGPDLTAALERCAGAALDQLGDDAPASVVFVFVSAAYAGSLECVPDVLRARFPDAVLAGCSAAGVTGGGREIEDRPAVSLTAGHLPNVNVTPFREAGSSATAKSVRLAEPRICTVTPALLPSFASHKLTARRLFFKMAEK